MRDYSLLRRSTYKPGELDRLPEWDLFLSAYNGSERVTTVFEVVRAAEKDWLVHAEYGLGDTAVPQDSSSWRADPADEAEFWREYLDARGIGRLPPDTRICVDITGFLRPHIMLLPKVIRDLGFKRLDVVYSGPVAYKRDEDTTFSRGVVAEIRQVRGFEGIHSSDGGVPEVLIIGSGYEDELIWRVAESRRAAKKIQLFGLPSLQPHMYEESRVRAARAAEAIGPLSRECVLFAPAGDPFVTAEVIRDQVELERQEGVSNVYLCPLSTKAQALGFAFYYLSECVGCSVSIVFPYVERYAQATSVGLSRVSLYRLELDWLM